MSKSHLIMSDYDVCARCGEPYDQNTGRHLHNESNLCDDLTWRVLRQDIKDTEKLSRSNKLILQTIAFSILGIAVLSFIVSGISGAEQDFVVLLVPSEQATGIDTTDKIILTEPTGTSVDTSGCHADRHPVQNALIVRPEGQTRTTVVIASETQPISIVGPEGQARTTVVTASETQPLPEGIQVSDLMFDPGCITQVDNVEYKRVVGIIS